MIKIKQNSFLEKNIFTLSQVIFYQILYYHLNTGYQIKINIDRLLNIDRLISCMLPLHLSHFQFLYVVLLILWQRNPAVS